MIARLRLGTQGWNYRGWVGPFYPVGTRPADMLRVYARAFNTVEVDATFYAIPAEPIVKGWRDRVPDDFVFALKVPQEITHERRLMDAADPLARFLARARLLEHKLGALLLQMAPDWRPTPATRNALSTFLGELPEDVRWAIEFRDAAWLTEPVLAQLRECNVALALADGRWIRRAAIQDLVAVPTADFAYVRWMGPGARRLSDYSRVRVDRRDELRTWAEALDALRARVTTVFGYFNNHFQGHSPQAVRDLQRLVGQVPVEPALLQEQAEFF